ncbi:MAG: EamA family transporter [Cardiobacteriaceae bacterium]|nr:EamA family transporter [Cardiobacteriaceae bacterium]
MTPIVTGTLLAIASNILFSLLFFYGKWLEPLSGSDIFAWRMFSMFPCLLISVGVSMSWRDVRAYARSLTKKQWVGVVASAPIMVGQMWLFMWSPVNGYGIDVAMGYFLFPLFLMLGGMVVFGERPNRAQRVATCLALCGVALEMLYQGKISWVSASIFLTYPVYYLFRRYLGVPAVLGLLFDIALIFPFVVVYLVYFSPSVALLEMEPSKGWWVLLLGAHSVLAMQLNLRANGLLPVVLFSMLSYLEPALLFVVSVVFLGEILTFKALLSYGLIWLGIVVMLMDTLATRGR